MAHESFEDPATAALMNELYVNIKVDREERPDIDAIYQHALQLLGEQGGWPLTMFLHAGGRALLGRHLFPAAGALRPAGLSSRCCAAFGRPSATRARTGREERRGAPQALAALGAQPAARAAPSMPAICWTRSAERLLQEFDRS